MTSQSQADPAISIDEIGIATARHGEVILRSAFQLVFRPEDGELRAVAAESFLRPFTKGMPLPPRPFLASLDANELFDVERHAAAIHLANHRHIGVDGLSHLLGLSCALASWLYVAGLLADRTQHDDMHEVPSAPLICGLRLPAGIESARLDALADILSAQEVQFALGGVAGEAPPLDEIRRLAPAIVRIEGAWFRRVACNDGAVRLLTSLVEGFHDQGAQVLVEGIETRGQLEAALRTRADLLQGYFLAHPQLVGSVVERAVLPLGDILPAPAPVIPLFGGR